MFLCVILNFLSDELKDDEDVVTKAAMQELSLTYLDIPTFYCYEDPLFPEISKRLRDDEDFICSFISSGNSSNIVIEMNLKNPFLDGDFFINIILCLFFQIKKVVKLDQIIFIKSDLSDTKNGKQKNLSILKTYTH